MPSSLWFEGPPRSIHRCPSTHPLVSSLHGRTASVHLSLGQFCKGRVSPRSSRVPHSERVFRMPIRRQRRRRDASDGDRELLVEPLGTVLQGAEIKVSYIVCGLPDDEPFTGRVTLRPIADGGVVGGVRRLLGRAPDPVDPVRISWDDHADGFATSRSRTITPREMEAGSYRVTLRIEDSGGRQIETSHDFTVVDR